MSSPARIALRNGEPSEDGARIPYTESRRGDCGGVLFGVVLPSVDILGLDGADLRLPRPLIGRVITGDVDVAIWRAPCGLAGPRSNKAGIAPASLSSDSSASSLASALVCSRAAASNGLIIGVRETAGLDIHTLWGMGHMSSRGPYPHRLSRGGDLRLVGPLLRPPRLRTRR